MMMKLEKKAKKGQGTIALVSATIVAFLVFIVVVIAVLLAQSSLNNAGIFATGTQNANYTNDLLLNNTEGISQFGSNIPTVFVVLGVLLIIGVIILLIVLIRRAQGTIGGGGAL